MSDDAPAVRPARVYAIVGPDGAGKTTVAHLVADRLRALGARPWITWMRSPRFFSYVPIALFRLTGIGKTVRLDGHDDVHTDLRAHPFLLHLFAWTVTFDYFFGFAVKVGLPRFLLRRTVICDRFVWDAIVDLSIASGMGLSFTGMPQGQILLKMGGRARAVVVSASREALVERRPILGLDPNLARRLALYREVAGTHGLGLMDSTAATEGETATEIFGALGLEAPAGR